MSLMKTITYLTLGLFIGFTQTTDPTPHVLVIGTGGTISGGVDPATGQARSLGAKDLVALVPSLKGKVQIEGKPDVAALYDERGQWFVDNVVGSPTP